MEVHCQLGCLYRKWSRFSRDRIGLRERALNHFKKATDLDSCHYPSICGKAEMEKALFRKENALEVFMDLFDGTFQDAFTFGRVLLP